MKSTKWLPIALCCVPGITITAIVGIGFIVGGVAFINSPLSVGLLILALLACPFSMGLMMFKMNRRMQLRQVSHCCVSLRVTDASEVSSPKVLTVAQFEDIKTPKYQSQEYIK